MEIPRAVLFDLDDTLAESFCPPTQKMLDAFERLLQLLPLAIVTGGVFMRVEHDFLSHMPPSSRFAQLHIFTDSGAHYFSYKQGAWNEEYSLILTVEERSHIRDVLLQVAESLPDFKDAPRYGERAAAPRGW